MHTASHDDQWPENRSHISHVPYMLPAVEQKIDRLDLQHYIIRYLLKGNYMAPVVKPAHILDVGCGTGRWIAEMAQEFPQAELNGFDFSLPVAGETLFPPHSHFHAGNMLNGLPFEDSFFDFVHQRHFIFTIPQLSWQQLVNELVRVTRRGGWVELIELNPEFQHTGPATERLLHMVEQTALKLGLDPAISHHMGTLLGIARLKRVGTSTQLVPLGNWGGQPGTMAMADILAMVQEMKPLIVVQTQTPPDEFDQLITRIVQEVEQYRTTFTFHIAYGQRQ
ncbi:MAG TPA: methyltransferase domain-containing protein [Ktedonobacteraceae bacterium]|nr:methyltransferase domain-containing protein [Ktedonobacteraceae bacterium]